MANKGAGARAAWSAASKGVLADLSKLLGERPIRRLEFDDGERARDVVMQAYGEAGRLGGISRQSFSSLDALGKAVRKLQLSSEPMEELLLMLQRPEQSGVYKASRGSLVINAPALLKYDGDTILIASCDGAAGFLLDYESDAPRAGQYELEYWGGIASRT